MTIPNLKLLRLTSIDPEDYEVIDARGERVGRIKRTIAVGGGEAWNWTVYGIAVTNHPPRRPGADAGSRAGGVQGSVGNLPAAGAGGLGLSPVQATRRRAATSGHCCSATNSGSACGPPNGSRALSIHEPNEDLGPKNGR